MQQQRPQLGGVLQLGQHVGLLRRLHLDQQVGRLVRLHLVHDADGRVGRQPGHQASGILILEFFQNVGRILRVEARQQGRLVMVVEFVE